MFKKDDDFIYKVDKDFDYIFDEKGNTFLALRKIAWGKDSKDYKLDLRKWYTSSDGSEKIGKGFSFITDEGPNELVRLLLEKGYGNTEQVVKSIKDRNDFLDALTYVVPYIIDKDSNENKTDKKKTPKYYDPKDVLF